MTDADKFMSMTNAQRNSVLRNERAAITATSKPKPRKCGGDLHSTFSLSFSPERAAGVLIRAGSLVACPYCCKTVKLRMPFNSADPAAYVQVPRHNRAI
jgi:hypothetical protein